MIVEADDSDTLDAIDVVDEKVTLAEGLVGRAGLAAAVVLVD